jgi:hypothetical protein
MNADDSQSPTASNKFAFDRFNAIVIRLTLKSGDAIDAISDVKLKIGTTNEYENNIAFVTLLDCRYKYQPMVEYRKYPIIV